MVATRSKRKRKSRRRYIPLIAVGVSVLLVGGAGFALVRTFLATNPGPPQLVVQHIQLIRPPPPPPNVPPPPPPPPEEKVDIPQPKEQPAPTPSDQPPPAPQLGLDAAGAAGSDAFGLLARQGGRDLLAGGGGSVYKWYAGVLQTDLRNLLQDDPKLRKGAYRATFRLWQRNDGSVERLVLLDSSGDDTRDKDKEVKRRLAEYTRSSQPPPAGIAQPITFQIETRG